MPIALRYTDMTNGSQLSNLYPLPINCTNSGDNILIPGIFQQQILVFRIFFVVAAQANIIFKDGTGINLTGPMVVYPGGTWSLDISGHPWFQTSRGNAFILNSDTAVQISGCIYYQQKI